jgi:Transcriptional regulators
MKNQNSRKVVMSDIAKATGYSVNTVSHALRNKKDVSENTKKYIKKTAAEMGFILDSIASSLRSGITKTISVIIGDIFNPHFGMWVRDIEINAFEHGYSTIIINTNEDEVHERNAIITSISKRVDGIIICPTQRSKENIEIIKKANIPYILLGRRYVEEEFNYIICDDEKGGELAVNYLISKGCRKILFLNGPEYISSAEERLRGYKKALSDSNIAFDKKIIKTVDIKSGNLKSIIHELLESKIEVDGIFAFSDILAFEIMTELKRHGEKYNNIPIIGFDNIMEKLILPVSMATVALKGESLASIALNKLCEIMKQHNDNGTKEQDTASTIKIISDVEVIEH